MAAIPNPNRTPGVTHAPAVVISNVSPSVEGGRYAIKQSAGQPVRIEADVFKDGHDILFVCAKWRSRAAGKVKAGPWERVPMDHLDNDRWAAELVLDRPGHYEFTVEAWPDIYRSWKHDMGKRIEAGQSELKLELIEGAEILESASEHARAAGDEDSASQLSGCVETMLDLPADSVAELLFSEDLQTIVDYWPDRRLATVYSPPHKLSIERERAAFSAWYEFFPRSAHGDTARPATLRDCLPRLDAASEMGFDVVYLPPVHPVGKSARKGPNNSATCAPGDPGSPWAIGSEDGGHYAIDPSLGTIADFEWLVGQARERGMEIAMDFALRCSPDHPYVTQHPEWFHHRPDGTIKYAENPPKKYQDIYPINFHCPEWRALWREARDIVAYWIARGVNIFRVDNPHTKPVAFWEYLITDIRSTHPDTVFLSEAFTRPKMMQMLAKIGFQQSYTYFTWRVTKQELTDYLEDLTQGPMREYYCGNLWPNTPDILPFHLHDAPPAMFKVRAALAATLSTSWGIYSGYEFAESTPLGPDKEEYLNSEKYQVASRDWNAPGIREFIASLNRIRRTNAALQSYRNLRFVTSLNDHVIAYLKVSEDGGNRILVVANLDPAHAQESTVYFPIGDFDIAEDAAYGIEDLLTGQHYKWRGSGNYVRLDPAEDPVHIFRF
ncbi:alpha-1,4-glucan--maltose-1-phosphate maltosyltransferase [soil metagenome]